VKASKRRVVLVSALRVCWGRFAWHGLGQDSVLASAWERGERNNNSARCGAKWILACHRSGRARRKAFMERVGRNEKESCPQRSGPSETFARLRRGRGKQTVRTPFASDKGIKWTRSSSEVWFLSCATCRRQRWPLDTWHSWHSWHSRFDN
jgi:hypothetical protein